MKKSYERQPIEVIIPENQQELDTVQQMIVNLKRQLNEALDEFQEPTKMIAGFTAIVADRAQFKTTALVQFVAERQMNLDPPARVGVVCPNYPMVDLFARAYQREFPTLRVRNPLVGVADDFYRGKWRGMCEIPEVYADEIFMIRRRELAQIENFVCGVGTLTKLPVTVKITNW